MIRKIAVLLRASPSAAAGRGDGGGGFDARAGAGSGRGADGRAAAGPWPWGAGIVWAPAPPGEGDRIIPVSDASAKARSSGPFGPNETTSPGDTVTGPLSFRWFTKVPLREPRSRRLSAPLSRAISACRCETTVS